MGTISITTPSDGQTIDAADVNSPLNVIVAAINGNLDSDNLATNAVTTAKITDANVTAVKLASDSVTTAKILDANVTGAKGAGAFLTSFVATATNASVLLTDNLIDSTEESAVKAVLTIPAGWTTYSVFAAATGRINGASTSVSAAATFNIKVGDGTAGASVVAVLCEVAAAAATDNECWALQGVHTGDTATGSVTYTLTTSGSADDTIVLNSATLSLIAFRTS